MNQYDAYVFQLLETYKKEKVKDKNKNTKDKKKTKNGFDVSKSDLDKDGKISKYEAARGSAIANAMANKKKN